MAVTVHTIGKYGLTLGKDLITVQAVSGSDLKGMHQSS